MENVCTTELKREMLENAVDVFVDSPLDFEEARSLARAEARKRQEEPMLMAWYDRESEVFSPRVFCCDDDEPSWLVYAKSRGADLFVSVNSESYVFVFRDGAKP